mmetsp:Transcript_36654/g.117564  ORF Transcript_36654/g.117564 Transcript_36654/m.117564 type:complete len:248 (-) Transcript_36654:609-1352(-)
MASPSSPPSPPERTLSLAEGGDFELLSVKQQTLRLSNLTTSRLLFLVASEKLALMWTESPRSGLSQYGIEWFAATASSEAPQVVELAAGEGGEVSVDADVVYLTVLTRDGGPTKTHFVRRLRVHAVREFKCLQKSLLPEATALFGPEQVECKEAKNDEVERRKVDATRDAASATKGGRSLRGGKKPTTKKRVVSPLLCCFCCLKNVLLDNPRWRLRRHHRQTRKRRPSSAQQTDDTILVIPPTIARI